VRIFLIAIAIFLITLHAYYFYQISLAPFPILGSILVIFLGISNRYSQKLLSRISLIAIFISISFSWALLNLIDYIYINTVIGTIINLIFLLFFIQFFKNIKSELVSKILKIVIQIHLLFFLIQFIAFYGFGLFIDYLGPITGENSRIEFGGAITGFARCTGLYNEPAAYSYFIGGLVFLRMLVTKQIDFISKIGLFSLILTLSISGIILAFLLYTYYVIFVYKKLTGILTYLTLITLITTLVILYFNDSIYSYIFDRFTNFSDDTSVNIRFTSSFEFLNTRGYIDRLFGLGLGNSVKNVGLATSGIVGIFTSFGIIGGLGFISLLFYSIRPKHIFDFLFFLIFLLSTITIQTVYFWFIFSIFYCKEKYYNEAN
jgi:hypothetical protein